MPKSQLVGTRIALDMINAARVESGLDPITLRAVQRFYIEKMGGIRIGRNWVFRLTDVQKLVKTIKRGQAG